MTSGGDVAMTGDAEDGATRVVERERERAAWLERLAAQERNLAALDAQLIAAKQEHAADRAAFAEWEAQGDAARMAASAAGSGLGGIGSVLN
jgi:hypothetical protein